MTYVDERVVELKFNNKQFEQETAKSMSTLDKLKEKLNFKNAESGASQLQRAVANINFNPVISGIGAIETKMSALGIAGKRVIENLTDWAMSGVNKVINKLNPIPQIITGGKSRAQNIEQAKFQLEGLGIAWADIQEDINYGVQDTAYGLDTAAKVASQLVASEVQLGDEMKHALLGISGVAAQTNSSYEEIGHIFTTVAGNGRLMGEQLNQFSYRGLNAAATIGKAIGKTEAEVRDMASKGQISFQMFSEAMFKAFGTHAKDANKTFTGALSNTKAALSRLGADVAAQGFDSIRDILNEVIPKLKEFKKQIKPLEDSIISMVGAVGKLIQVFVKAIDIEGIVKRIMPPIKKAVETVTEFLDGYRMIFEEKHANLFSKEEEGLNKLTDSTEKAKDEMVDLLTVTEEQKKMADDIWKYGTYGNGADRIAALGENYANVQAYLEKMIELGWDEAKMEEYLADEQKKRQEEATKSEKTNKRKETIEKFLAILNNLKIVVKNVFGSIGNVLSVASNTFKNAFSSSSVLGGFINLTGRLAEVSAKLFITRDRAEKLRPVFELLGKIIKLIGKGAIAAVKGFSFLITKIGELYEKAKNNKNLIKIRDNLVNAFTTIVNTVITVYEKLKERGIIKAVLNGLGAIFEFVTNVLATGIGSLSDIIGGLVDGAGKGISTLADAFSFLFTTILNGLRGPLSSLAGGIGDIIEAISFRQVVEGSALFIIANVLYTIFSIFRNIGRIGKGITELGASLVEFFVSLKDVAEAKARQINIESLVMVISAVTKLVWAILALTVVMAVVPNADKMAWQAFAIVAIITALYGAIDIISKKVTESTKNGKINATFGILNGGKMQMGILFAGIATLLLAIIKGISTLYKIVSDKNYDPGALLASLVMMIGFIGLLAGTALGMMYALSKFDKIKKVGRISLFIFTFALSFKMILNSVMELYNITKTETNMNRFVAIIGITVALYGIIFGLLYALNKLKKIPKITAISVLLLSYAFSIKIIIGAVSEMINAANAMGNPENFRRAVESVIAILGVVGLIIIAMMGISSLSKKRIKTSAFFGISAVILSFAVLLKSITPALDTVGKIYKEYGGSTASDSLWGLIRVIGVLGLILIAIQALATKNRVTDIIPMVGLVVVILSLSHAIKTLGKTIKLLSDIDSSKIKSIATSIGFVIGILIGLTAILGKLAGPDGAIAILAISALILSLGASMYLAGKGFKYFGDTLMAFVTSLPTIIDKLLEFFTKVSNNKEAIKQGIIDTVSLMVEGAIDGITAGLKSLVTSVPLMIATMAEAFIAAINGLADTIFEQGDDFVDATNRLTASLVYLFLYAQDHAFDWVKKALKKKVAEVIEESIPSGMRPEKGWGDTFGTKTTTTGVITDPEEVKRLYANKGKEDAKNAADGYMKGWEQQRAKEEARMAKIGEKDESFGLVSSILDNPESDKIVNSKIGKKVQKWFDVDLSSNGTARKYAKDLEKELGASFDTIKNSYLTGDMTQFAKESGYNITYEQLQGMVDGAMDGKTDVVDAIDQIDWEVGNAEDDTVEDAFDSGELWSQNLANGVTSKREEVIKASADIQDSVLEKINSYKPKMYDAAINLVEGYKLGLHDAVSRTDAYRSVADLGTRTQDTLKKILGERSPSKKAAVIGEYFVQGFINGILDLSSAAESATEDVGEESMSALQMILDRLFNTTMENMNVNPTITPVLDLSQVEAGITSMNGMFDNNSSYGLAFGNVAAYNNGLSAKFAGMKVQNEYDGNNVVEAVNSLRNDISEIKTAMGTLGFYVDGKQMATAIADPMSSALNKIAVNTGRGVK